VTKKPDSIVDIRTRGGKVKLRSEVWGKGISGTEKSGGGGEDQKHPASLIATSELQNWQRISQKMSGFTHDHKN